MGPSSIKDNPLFSWRRGENPWLAGCRVTQHDADHQSRDKRRLGWCCVDEWEKKKWEKLNAVETEEKCTYVTENSDMFFNKYPPTHKEHERITDVTKLGGAKNKSHRFNGLYLLSFTSVFHVWMKPRGNRQNKNNDRTHKYDLAVDLIHKGLEHISSRGGDSFCKTEICISWPNIFQQLTTCILFWRSWKAAIKSTDLDCCVIWVKTVASNQIQFACGR